MSCRAPRVPRRLIGHALTETAIGHNVAMLRLLPVLVGLVLVAAGTWLVTSQRRARERWVRVDGSYEGPSQAIESAATSIVRFRTLEGREILGSPRTSTDVGVYPSGRTVPVWYDPDDPERFETQVLAADRWIGPALIVAGLLPLGWALAHVL